MVFEAVIAVESKVGRLIHLDPMLLILKIQTILNIARVILVFIIINTVASLSDDSNTG